MSVENNLFRPGEYLKPSTISEAIDWYLQYGESARYIAGGTDLLNEKDPCVETLIDINGLNLNYLRQDADGVKIGATTTFAEIVDEKLLTGHYYGVLRDAAARIGTPQIRNTATIGGNICYAVPSADMASLLLALDATVIVNGKQGERSMPIEDFFRGVRECALKKGEMLIEIQLPAPEGQMSAMFMKEGRVITGDLAVINVAIRLDRDSDGYCGEPRIAMGAVAPVPMRAKKAEEILKGQKPDEGVFRKAAEQASQEIQPISDVRASAEYRKVLCKVMVERMLREVWGRFSQ